MNGITRVTQGSVYEMDNGQMALVISDNRSNSTISNTITCCKIVQEDADNFPFRIVYDTMSGDVVIPNKILCNVIFSTKPTRLKIYKYSLDDTIMSKVRKEVQKVLFGEELYSINEARNAIAEHDLAIRVALEKQNGITQVETPVTNNIVMPTPTISVSQSKPIIDDNSSIDDIQSYYAKKMSQEFVDYDYNTPSYSYAEASEEEEDETLDMDFEGEDPETTARVLNTMFMNEKATLERMGEEEYDEEYQKLLHKYDDYEEEEEKLSKPRKITKRKKKKRSKINVGLRKGALILTTEPTKVEEEQQVESKSGKKSRYDYIYNNNNYLNYLESYYNDSKEMVSKTYGVDIKNLGNVAYRCRQICEANGEMELLNQIKKEAGVRV